MPQLLGIFLNILAPVFLLVLAGYLAGPRLGLDARTITRVAYFILTPAFTFDVLSTATIEAALATRMALYIVAVYLLTAAAGYGVARLLRRPAEVVAAYVLIIVFGNVGNFGLPIVRFAFAGARESEALVAAAVYFLIVVIVSFVVGVAAANWHRGGSLRAMVAVLKTPALLAVPPALLLNGLNITLPPALARPIALLSAALIPVMLLALGVQLASVARPRFDRDILIAAGIRLVGGAALGFALAAPFGLSGVARDVGVIQASMPTAVLASIIAVEHDLLPNFVIAAVLFSTLASVVTLTAVLALL
jgi:predicted permease